MTVQGTVTDEFGETLIGVSVVVKGQPEEPLLIMTVNTCWNPCLKTVHWNSPM